MLSFRSLACQAPARPHACVQRSSRSLTVSLAPRAERPQRPSIVFAAHGSANTNGTSSCTRPVRLPSRGPSSTPSSQPIRIERRTCVLSASSHAWGCWTQAAGSSASRPGASERTARPSLAPTPTAPSARRSWGPSSSTAIGPTWSQDGPYGGTGASTTSTFGLVHLRPNCLRCLQNPWRPASRPSRSTPRAWAPERRKLANCGTWCNRCAMP